MPTYKVTDPTTGKTITLTGDSPPTEQELNQVFAQLQRRAPGPPPPATPTLAERMTGQSAAVPTDVAAQNDAMRSRMAGTAPPDSQGDLGLQQGLGLAKGLGEGALSVVNPMTYVHAAQGLMALPGQAMDAIKNPAAAVQGAKDTFNRLNTQTTAEDVGRVVGATAAPGAIANGVSAASEAFPRIARAGENFQAVMGAAKDVPVDIEAPGQVALRAMDLGERGATLPTPVSKFIRFVTDPKRGDFTYEQARDFASNISRLSANDYQKLTPVMGRQVAELSVTLNKAVADAAQTAGKGSEYRAAMTEYARAMKIRDAVSGVVAGAKSAAPGATAAGTGYWLTSRLIRLLGS